MQITALSAQLRNPDRVNVSIDGAYRLSLDISQVTDLRVKVGQELNADDLVLLEQESQFGKLYARALEYCMLRPRAIKEMRDYLWRKTRPVRRRSPKTGELIERPGVNSAIAERVLQRLIDKKYLNDEQFARFWFEHRFVKKGTSLRRLKLELAQKGIDRDIVEQLASEHIRSDTEELQKIIAKKRHKYPDRQKLLAYLARQGFSYDDIVAAVDGDA
ncbi:MAG: RecX family transcriptional regulator [Candidatus Saccharibacteria bacterium]|nr:RecX family transcriptional regulator [Candidatus Saccharibacteria bacterium]